MVRFLFLVLLFHEVHSMCPEIKKTYLNCSSIAILTLYKYKSVDQRIQSPFFVSDGETKNIMMTFIVKIKTIVSSCYYLKQNVTPGKTPLGTVVFKTINLKRNCNWS